MVDFNKSAIERAFSNLVTPPDSDDAVSAVLDILEDEDVSLELKKHLLALNSHDGMNLVHYAARMPDLTLLHSILKIDPTEAHRMTMMSHQYYSPDDNLGQHILSQQCNTALHFAAHYGNLGAVTMLLQAGAEVDHSRDRNLDTTPLELAEFEGHHEVAMYLSIYLMANGTNDTGFAVLKKYLDEPTAIINFLRSSLNSSEVKAGLLSLSTKDGMSLVHYAARMQDLTLLGLILEIAPKEAHRMTMTSQQNYSPDDNIGRHILSQQCYTALHFAAHYGNLEAVMMLLQAGAEIDHRRDANFYATALHLAALEDHRDVALYLVAHGARLGALIADGASLGAQLKGASAFDILTKHADESIVNMFEGIEEIQNVELLRGVLKVSSTEKHSEENVLPTINLMQFLDNDECKKYKSANRIKKHFRKEYKNNLMLIESIAENADPVGVKTLLEVIAKHWDMDGKVVETNKPFLHKALNDILTASAPAKVMVRRSVKYLAAELDVNLDEPMMLPKPGKALGTKANTFTVGRRLRTVSRDLAESLRAAAVELSSVGAVK